MSKPGQFTATVVAPKDTDLLCDKIMTLGSPFGKKCLIIRWKLIIMGCEVVNYNSLPVEMWDNHLPLEVVIFTPSSAWPLSTGFVIFNKVIIWKREETILSIFLIQVDKQSSYWSVQFKKMKPTSKWQPDSMAWQKVH